MSRSSTRAASIGLVLGVTLGAGILVATPAHAACTTYFPANPTVVEVATDVVAVFAVPNLCLGATPTVAVPTNPDGMLVSVNSPDTPAATLSLTPPGGFVGDTIVRVTVGDGTVTHDYTLVAYFGLPAPSPVHGFFPENPPAVDIVPGATGYFSLSGLFVPRLGGSAPACQLTITQTPSAAEVPTVTEPPTLTGIGPNLIPVYLSAAPDFVGVLTVNYGISCVLTDGFVAARTYPFVLYVGVPRPAVLADTGIESDTHVLVALGLIAAGGIGVVASRRRRPAR